LANIAILASLNHPLNTLSTSETPIPATATTIFQVGTTIEELAMKNITAKHDTKTGSQHEHTQHPPFQNFSSAGDGVGHDITGYRTAELRSGG
jgi:hypothetical protein